MDGQPGTRGGDRGFAIVLALVVAVLGASAAPWWWPLVTGSSSDGPPAGVTGFVGSCDPFRVYAQNRYPPLGAAIRAAPEVESRQMGSEAGNKAIIVDGWVRSRVGYPSNPPPWDSDVWFHLADDSGWVSFAGVRELPTSPDESGLDPDGGPPAPASEACHGAIA